MPLYHLAGIHLVLRHQGCKRARARGEVGLDAVVFLRFLHMIRSIFHILTIFGCGILTWPMWLAATVSMISEDMWGLQ